MKILTVFAHIDDAEIWCGGTLAKHSTRGDTIHTIAFTDKEEKRIAESNAAHKLINGTLTVLKRDIHNDSFSLVKKIEEILFDQKPDILISHWKDDSHPDHRKIFDIVSQALIWPWIYNKSPLYFFSVDTYSSQGLSQAFNPDYIIDISETWQTKINMIHCFKSQPINIWKNMVAIQNKFYGERIESEYAEAFIQNPIQGKKIKNLYLPFP